MHTRKFTEGLDLPVSTVPFASHQFSKQFLNTYRNSCGNLLALFIEYIQHDNHTQMSFSVLKEENECLEHSIRPM